MAAAIGAVAAIAQVFDYINSGRANLVIGGTVLTVIAIGVIIALTVNFSGHPRGTRWAWHQKLVFWSLMAVAASGATLGFIALKPTTSWAAPSAPATTASPLPSPVQTEAPTTPAGATQTVVPQAAVSWNRPADDGPAVAPKQNVALVGTVVGVSDDHTVWVVSKPYSADSDYFVVEGRPLRTGSGDFTATDYGVGDASDSGQGFTYTAIDADEACRDQLARAGEDDVHRLDGEPGPSCRRLAPTARIDIK